MSLQDGFYRLWGSVESPEDISFTFVKLPFSRERIVKNPDHWQQDALQELITTNNIPTDCWDNPPFLFQRLLPLLKIAYSFRHQIIEHADGPSQLLPAFWALLNEQQTSLASSLLQDIPVEDWACVYEIFQEAKRVGFLALYHNRSVPKTLEVISQISNFYRAQTPDYFADHLIETATEAQIVALERMLDEQLSADYKTFLRKNQLAFDFDGNFRVLPFNEVVERWEGMNQLLAEGTFDDGRVEHHLQAGFGNWQGGYIKQVWWNKKWVPFAEDSCGNMKCIDFEPGDQGSMYQLILMEVQDGQGPFLFSKYQFIDYLSNHLEYLQDGYYRLVEYGKSNMIEVDSYLKPNR